MSTDELENALAFAKFSPTERSVFVPSDHLRIWPSAPAGPSVPKKTEAIFGCCDALVAVEGAPEWGIVLWWLPVHDFGRHRLGAFRSE